MDTLIFITLFIISISITTKAHTTTCLTTKCSPSSPNIRFPFRLQPHQIRQYRFPGFDLSCNGNDTIFHFPSYGNLIVKSISYDIRKLDLVDPKSCVHEVFLNLDLSITPFEYYYIVKNYTYLNCSDNLSAPFIEVPCLSGLGFHIYVVNPGLDVPRSCREVKTVAIPFEYSPYLDDNSFGLGLTWGLQGCEDCEAKGGFLKAHEQVLSMMSMITVGVAILLIMTIRIYGLKKLSASLKEVENQIEDEESLGEYKSLKLTNTEAEPIC